MPDDNEISDIVNVVYLLLSEACMVVYIEYQWYFLKIYGIYWTGLLKTSENMFLLNFNSKL